MMKSLKDFFIVVFEKIESNNRVVHWVQMNQCEFSKLQKLDKENRFVDLVTSTDVMKLGVLGRIFGASILLSINLPDDHYIVEDEFCKKSWVCGNNLCQQTVCENGICLIQKTMRA